MSTESSKTRKIFDGRYEIVSIVGRGAASVVYHGRRATAPYADVAIKVLTDKGATVPARERLRKEALAMLYARHRYVIRLDDFRSVGDLCYLSMEYAPHKDLRIYITERGAECTPPQRERFFLQAAEALGYIHRAGLIHRDIKPDNILVMNEAEIRIADFGVAVLPSDEASLSELQRGVGTLDYLAPEVLDGVRCDQRSDVYSLGVTFYELLAGQHPFSQTPLAEQLEVRRDGAFVSLIEVAPQVPDYINTAIMRCLAFDPAARFENGQQLFESLLLGRDKSKRKTKNRARGAQNLGSKDKIESDIAAELDPIAAAQANDSPTPLPVQLAVGEMAGGGDEEILAERDVARETVLIPREQVAAARNEEQRIATQRETPPTLASPTSQVTEIRRETSTNFQVLSPATTQKPEAELEKLPYPTRQSVNEILENLRERAAPLLELAASKLEELQADPRTKKYLPIAAIVAATLLGIAIMSGRDTAVVEGPASSNLIATVTAPSRPAVLSFPQLPPGRYEGRVEGILPGVVSPLAFIVPADSSAIITLVGIDGWSPVRGRYPTGAGSDKLRVSANGFLIDFTGQVDGEAVVGFFNDRSTGAQGRWEARMAR